jgi:hypothetical protein
MTAPNGPPPLLIPEAAISIALLRNFLSSDIGHNHIFVFRDNPTGKNNLSFDYHI